MFTCCLSAAFFGFKPKLRLEWQDQQSQQEDEQPDHYATVSDFGPRSRRMRFSVHTRLAPRLTIGLANLRSSATSFD
jgi:hypothetical protein